MLFLIFLQLYFRRFVEFPNIALLITAPHQNHIKILRFYKENVQYFLLGAVNQNFISLFTSAFVLSE